MDMKAAMDLTYNNKAIYYYSMSGNTKALVELSNTTGYDLINLAKTNPFEFSFGDYETILIGTSTVGRGVPHKYFQNIYTQLISLHNKKIGLFGSGNSIYDVYCGALDILEELLIEKNSILFKFRFESYPTNRVVEDFNKLIHLKNIIREQ
ncbi:flavodoxin family protein [Paenibacillus sp. EKM202P]|uniref:flavodoxin family protein n=1 Tax=unclassified Paenibacillus TaxID=185978 RepID=UPI0013EADD23|nr:MULTISPECIES: flavodoxin family protein [unclassified Paenibacillus]KAF6565295.1 flavodoxin family protein [Paenibacillus sp. EKM202P]KAF6569379.1 flavodoxin family protein [Paenibacillus sp. EKM207P]